MHEAFPLECPQKSYPFRYIKKNYRLDHMAEYLRLLKKAKCCDFGRITYRQINDFHTRKKLDLRFFDSLS